MTVFSPSLPPESSTTTRMRPDASGDPGPQFLERQRRGRATENRRQTGGDAESKEAAVQEVAPRTAAG